MKMSTGVSDCKLSDSCDNDHPEFDRYAPSYDELLTDPARDHFARDPLHFHKRKWILIKRLLKQVGADASSLRWLDVGCGRGELLWLAGGHFVQAFGCDPSAAMLPSRAPFSVSQQKSLVELPFEAGSVDFVTAICVFHHVHGEARSKLIREMMRVLTPGGLCCVIEHNPWNPVTRGIVRRCPVDGDAELLTPRVARALLHAADFVSITTDYFLFLPESLFSNWSSLETAFGAVPLGGQYAVLGRTQR